MLRVLFFTVFYLVFINGQQLNTQLSGTLYYYLTGYIEKFPCLVSTGSDNSCYGLLSPLHWTEPNPFVYCTPKIYLPVGSQYWVSSYVMDNDARYMYVKYWNTDTGGSAILDSSELISFKLFKLSCHWH